MPGINFYKVTFLPPSSYRDRIVFKPVVTPLADDQIWSENGLDKTNPCIIINPGDGSINQEHLSSISENDKEVQNCISNDAKIFERGVMQYIGDFPEKRQYLIPVNERKGEENFELIRQHNANPDGFTTDYTSNQAKLMYGPLVANGETPLSDEEIVKNLSNIRIFNASFGTVTANCQINALRKMMSDLGISEETIKEALESMRRLDISNISVINPGFSPSGVILEASNDILAKEYIGGKIPPIPEDHQNISRVPIDDHLIKIYQRVPEEVYHPGKRATEDERAIEDETRKILSKVYKRIINDSKREEKDIPNIQSNVLKFLGLDGLRYQDKKFHSAPHLTLQATPGNEVQGRDPDLVYKLMTDMLTRKDAKDVTSYQKYNNANVTDNSR